MAERNGVGPGLLLLVAALAFGLRHKDKVAAGPAPGPVAISPLDPDLGIPPRPPPDPVNPEFPTPVPVPAPRPAPVLAPVPRPAPLPVTPSLPKAEVRNLEIVWSPPVAMAPGGQLQATEIRLRYQGPAQTLFVFVGVKPRGPINYNDGTNFIQRPVRALTWVGVPVRETPEWTSYSFVAEKGKSVLSLPVPDPSLAQRNRDGGEVGLGFGTFDTWLGVSSSLRIHGAGEPVQDGTVLAERNILYLDTDADVGLIERAAAAPAPTPRPVNPEFPRPAPVPISPLDPDVPSRPAPSPTPAPRPAPTPAPIPVNPEFPRPGPVAISPLDPDVPWWPAPSPAPAPRPSPTPAPIPVNPEFPRPGPVAISPLDPDVLAGLRPVPLTARAFTPKSVFKDGEYVIYKGSNGISGPVLRTELKWGERWVVANTSWGEYIAPEDEWRRPVLTF